MDIQEALYEALSRRRQDLHVEQKVQESNLPRNGKNPATESDRALELQRIRQLEVLERCLSAVPEMAPVVNKGGRPLMSSPASPPPPPKAKEQVPERPSTILEKTTPTYFAADDDEPYVNPFTGLMVYPVTKNSAGPSGTQSRRHYPKDETQPTILNHGNRVTSNSTILQQSNVTSSSIPTVGAQTVVADEKVSQAVARDSSSVYRQAVKVARPEKLLTSTPTLTTKPSFISTDSTDHFPSYDASKPPKGSKWGLFGLRGGRLRKSEVDDIMIDEGPPPSTPKLTLPRAPPKRASLSVRRDQSKARTKPKELFSPGSGPQSSGVVRTVQVIPDATLFRQPSHRLPVELETPRQLPNTNVPVRQPPILPTQPSRAPNSIGTSTNQSFGAKYGSHWGGTDSGRAPPVEATSPPPRYSQIHMPGSALAPQTFTTNWSAPPPYQSSPPGLPPELDHNLAQAELDGSHARELARQGSMQSGAGRQSAARFTQRNGVAELPGSASVAVPALSQFEADRALAVQLAENDGSLESPGGAIPGLDLAQFLGEDEVDLGPSGFFEQQKTLLAAYALQAHDPEPSGSRSGNMENARRMQQQFDNEYAQQIKQEEYAKRLQQRLQDEHAREIEAQAKYAQQVQDEWAEAERRNIEAAEKLRRAEQKRLAEERRRLEEQRCKEQARLEAEKRKKEEARRKAEEEQKEQKKKAEEERLRKEQMDECMACGDEHENNSAALAYSACKHPYCLRCLAIAFKNAIKDKKPFSCCRQRVDIGLAARHLDAAFIKSYQLLELELDTPHPLYCSQPRCSKFIVPSAIQGGAGTCSTCGALTCRYCRKSNHTGVCVEDKDGLKFRALGKAKGWKECPGCGAMVEKIDGCLHMVCGCGAEFCYSCGDRYNNCNQTCSRE